MTCSICKELMEIVENQIGPPTWQCYRCGAEIPDGFPIVTKEQGGRENSEEA